ncbi:MAG: ATP-dependent 6-phosphofructokinase [Desulfovibrio sp.]|jgi:6-phosphofructokinase 1|nr:ATP-dependent 6-phosphofructokinase [Desulfovibrio sp.]
MKPLTSFSVGDFTLHTNIDTLGRAAIPSPLPESSHIGASETPLFLDGEYLEELSGRPPLAVSFEAAGPRPVLYFDASKTKCAVVTCGGLCPGINDVIRSIVMEAFHKYGIRAVFGIRYGLEGFIPKFAHEVEELTPEKVTDIHQFGGTILGSSRGPQDPEEIVDALERMNVNALFLIGGDGTMRASSGIYREIAKRGLRVSVIGIPKTIDNDISFINQSFGFETAVFKAAEAIQCAHTEALGYKNCVGIVKLMGRESGFIAAHAALALKEVNFILIPEIPFALHGPGGLLQELTKRLSSRKHAVIVVAEGAGQHLTETRSEKDPSGNPVLGDIAEVLRREISAHLRAQDMPFTIKYIDPSYTIRAVPANANDRVYCGFLGQNAVHAAMAGRTNMVVAKLMDRYVHLPLEAVTRTRRKLNVHSGYWQAVLDSIGQPELALYSASGADGAAS